MRTHFIVFQRHKVHPAFRAIPRLIRYDLRMHRAGILALRLLPSTIFDSRTIFFGRHLPIILSMVSYHSSLSRFDLVISNVVTLYCTPFHYARMN
tara:strand:- start:181 stop:465 length:285 start_codon:yes stop_codon:yes gene_type:complete